MKGHRLAALAAPRMQRAAAPQAAAGHARGRLRRPCAKVNRSRGTGSRLISSTKKLRTPKIVLDTFREGEREISRGITA